MSKFTMVVTDDYVVEGELVEDQLFLHMEFLGEKFTRGMYAKLLKDWVMGMDELKSRGFDHIYSCVPKDDEKVNKWQGMFGLTPCLECETHYIYKRCL